MIWQNGKAVLRDRLGSVMARSGDYTGLERHDYFPYGEERTPTAGDRNKYGTYHRDQTGLDFADQRYYNSTIGRFLSADPYEASGGASEPANWGRGVYVHGDPIHFNDPQGLQACPVGTGICYYPQAPLPPQSPPGPPFPGGQPSEPNPPPLEVLPDDIPVAAGQLPGIDVARRGPTKIASGNWEASKECQDFLEQLPSGSRGVPSGSSLMSSVRSVAARAAHMVYEGPTSYTELDEERLPGTATATVRTVGQWFQS